MSGVPYWGPVTKDARSNPWDTCTLYGDSTTTNDPDLSKVFVGADSAIDNTPVNGYSITLPGICKVKVKKSKRFDVQPAAGRDNATIYFRGVEPAEVTIQFTVWTPQQWNLMQQVLDALDVPPNKGHTQPSYAVSHPVTLARRIRPVVIKTISGPDPGEWAGSHVVVLDCIEYAPPPLQPAKEASTIGAAGNKITGRAERNTGGPKSTASGAVPPSVGKKPKP